MIINTSTTNTSTINALNTALNTNTAHSENPLKPAPHLDFTALAQQYRDNLLNDVVPFWLKHSLDTKHGGFYTCLDAAGRVYDTDKFVWLQGRQVWTFSMLYNNVAESEQREQWLQTALHGASFLERFGADASGNFYFSLTQEGAPLVQPYNIFSDCFACMAFAQLGVATGRESFQQKAKTIFENILLRQHNWKGAWNKAYPGTRALKNFSLPMILCNLTLELGDVISPELAETSVNACVHEVMNVFLRSEHLPNTNRGKGLILENVALDGAFANCYEGRLLNPGHGIEAMWFIMDIAVKQGNMSLVELCKETTLRILEHSWDEQYGGIFYFLDVLGNDAAPPQQLEWDQKLWWVHVETLVALAKAYLHTGDERCAAWLRVVHDYTWSRFPDPASGLTSERVALLEQTRNHPDDVSSASHASNQSLYKQGGEWFGYLNRRGEVLLPLKGGKWKGSFHVPRSLYQCWRTFEAIAAKQQAEQSAK
jgi:N-acylglucosamine 2-epimerase